MTYAFLPYLRAPALAIMIAFSASAQSLATSPATSIEPLKILAEQGDAQAQANLGDWYRAGSGAAPDWEQARFWYEKAGAQSHARALNHLGVLYWHGHGVEKNPDEAVKLYTRSADLGDGVGALNLAYAFGQGVGIPKDDAAALKWLSFAAEKSIPAAQVMLAKLYAAGSGGVKQSLVVAYALSNLAASGSTEAAQEARGIRDAIEGKITAADMKAAQALSAKFLSDGVTAGLANYLADLQRTADETARREALRIEHTKAEEARLLEKRKVEELQALEIERKEARNALIVEWIKKLAFAAGILAAVFGLITLVRKNRVKLQSLSSTVLTVAQVSTGKVASGMTIAGATLHRDFSEINSVRKIAVAEQRGVANQSFGQRIASATKIVWLSISTRQRYVVVAATATVLAAVFLFARPGTGIGSSSASGDNEAVVEACLERVQKKYSVFSDMRNQTAAIAAQMNERESCSAAGTADEGPSRYDLLMRGLSNRRCAGIASMMRESYTAGQRSGNWGSFDQLVRFDSHGCFQ
jgi:TPR repeat protein